MAPVIMAGLKLKLSLPSDSMRMASPSEILIFDGFFNGGSPAVGDLPSLCGRPGALVMGDKLECLVAGNDGEKAGEVDIEVSKLGDTAVNLGKT